MSNKKFKKWKQAENDTWKLLSNRQFPNLKGRASKLWFTGFEQLSFAKTEIPDFDQVSQKLSSLSGWELTPTSQVFADGETWFQLLKRKQMLISDYIRPKDSLEYTPMPDVFHDAFGHLPFFVNAQFCRIVQIFTERILDAETAEREALGHLWWYSVEFGLVKEKGQIKALGAGLISSFGELNRIFSQQTKIEPFNADVVAKTQESHHQFHDQLFLLDSLDALEEVAQNWTLHSI